MLGPIALIKSLFCWVVWRILILFVSNPQIWFTLFNFIIFFESGELSPYIQLEDAPDVAATSIVPKLYFFPWIIKPLGDNESVSPQNEHFGDSSFQFVIALNLLPLVILS